MAVISSAPTASAVSRPRMLFVDNLRWTMIMLVISMHAADTYSPLAKLGQFHLRQFHEKPKHRGRCRSLRRIGCRLISLNASLERTVPTLN